MRKIRRKHSGHDRAFTLIELTFAILLLSGALVVLLGLQTSILTRTAQDKQNQRAMMFARQILSAIEVNTIALEIQDTTGTIEEILEGLIEIDSDLQKELQNTTDLQARLQVRYWGIPNVNDQAMKRVELDVSWSDAPRDVLKVIYFLPFDESDVPS